MVAWGTETKVHHKEQEKSSAGYIPNNNWSGGASGFYQILGLQLDKTYVHGPLWIELLVFGGDSRRSSRIPPETGFPDWHTRKILRHWPASNKVFHLMGASSHSEPGK